MVEKLLFIPSGSVIADTEKGVDSKHAIELHGHDAGEFVISSKVSQLEKQLSEKIAKQKEVYENKT